MFNKKKNYDTYIRYHKGALPHENSRDRIRAVRRPDRQSVMAEGDILEVLLTEGEPLDNVPRSATEQGYKVLSTEKVEGTTYKVTIQK